MTEKLNTEQIGGEIARLKEQSFAINPETELTQPKTTAAVQPSIVKIDPKSLNNSIPEGNKINDKQQEHISADIKTSGSKWSEVIENKQRVGVEIELPL